MRKKDFLLYFLFANRSHEKLCSRLGNPSSKDSALTLLIRNVFFFADDNGVFSEVVQLFNEAFRSRIAMMNLANHRTVNVIKKKTVLNSKGDEFEWKERRFSFSYKEFLYFISPLQSETGIKCLAETSFKLSLYIISCCSSRAEQLNYNAMQIVTWGDGPLCVFSDTLLCFVNIKCFYRLSVMMKYHYRNGNMPMSSHNRVFL